MTKILKLVAEEFSSTTLAASWEVSKYSEDLNYLLVYDQKRICHPLQLVEGCAIQTQTSFSLVLLILINVGL